jgi:hypothetical protein
MRMLTGSAVRTRTLSNSLLSIAITTKKLRMELSCKMTCGINQKDVALFYCDQLSILNICTLKACIVENGRFHLEVGANEVRSR